MAVKKAPAKKPAKKVVPGMDGAMDDKLINSQLEKNALAHDSWVFLDCGSYGTKGAADLVGELRKKLVGGGYCETNGHELTTRSSYSILTGSADPKIGCKNCRTTWDVFFVRKQVRTGLFKKEWITVPNMVPTTV